MVEQRHADLQSMRHAHLIGVPQQHVMHIRPALGVRDGRQDPRAGTVSIGCLEKLDVGIGVLAEGA